MIKKYRRSLYSFDSVSLLALGDSYTLGEGVLQRKSWPMQLTCALERKGVKMSPPTIIAKTGWTTDELKNAIEASELKADYIIVSLLIGVNNQYRGRSSSDYAKEYKVLLKQAISFLQEDKRYMFALSIPDYGYTPFGEPEQKQITEGIDQFNAVNRKITRKFGVHYIDITDISRKGLDNPDFVCPDGLHPSEKQYALWVSRMVERLTMK